MSDTGFPLAASQTRAVQSIDVVTTMRPFLLKCAVLISLSWVSEAPICPICADSGRDARLLCVVETPADQAALERTASYPGYYFVLMGRVSPLDAVGIGSIGVAELLLRAAETEVEEVILATSFTAEGEATAHVLAEGLRSRGVRSTRLARGVPVGSELEFVDLGTIAHALFDRR